MQALQQQYTMLSFFFDAKAWPQSQTDPFTCTTVLHCGHTFLNLPLHLLTCVSRVIPYRYSFFVNASFIWNTLPGSILCVQVIIDKSHLLTMFLVFLSFVSLCKGDHYYRIFLLSKSQMSKFHRKATIPGAPSYLSHITVTYVLWGRKHCT